MPRKRKLTVDEHDRKSQRELAKKVAEFQNDKNLNQLPTEPPKTLKGFARKMWKILVPELRKANFVTEADQSTVESFCMAVEMRHLAYSDIEKNGIQSSIFKTVVNPTTGEVISHDFCGFRKNPAVTTLSDSIAKIKSLANELGLTPSSRASLLARVENDDDDEPSLNDLINGGDEDF